MPDIGKTPAPRSKDGDAKQRAQGEYDSPWKEITELFFERLTALLPRDRPATLLTSANKRASRRSSGDKRTGR